ncbi:LDCC motif putative metal-binding protein [Tissierella praeacuta]
MKKLIRKWLNKLEEANKESFGSESLDCCHLGKKTNTVQASKKTSQSN